MIYFILYLFFSLKISRCATKAFFSLVSSFPYDLNTRLLCKIQTTGCTVRSINHVCIMVSEVLKIDTRYPQWIIHKTRSEH